MTKKPNKNMHSDKIKLRRFAMQLYFAGDVKRTTQLRDRLGDIELQAIFSKK